MKQLWLPSVDNVCCIKIIRDVGIEEHLDNASTHLFDISRLKKGFYLLEITAKHRKIVKQFIKE